eukprot:8086833-Prorocentrum_lima.AAC.1
MTSSLVGSEMCIRDRGAGRFRGPLAAAWCVNAIRTALLTAYPDEGLPILCLLYTSDAADDM